MKTETLAVKERPLLYSAPMVRAILAGDKSQTRRMVSLQPKAPTVWVGHDGLWRWGQPHQFPSVEDFEIGMRCPHGEPGDRLWVREAFALYRDLDGHHPVYRADVADHEGRSPTAEGWKPAIHMPRWASRITLEITEVRVERVQSITPADALAEGIAEYAAAKGHGDSGRAHPVEAFAELWDEINAKRGFSWAWNPWVWAVSFRRIGGPG